ncbi:LysR family transcriptional regulator [Vibrio sp. ZSDZ34]|jgi:DNA-binding transcriptional LysR family regulator|uniref:LysR family transcriptional regulator n=1 Tax=Vibrio gelatinilyticus TaxID=2893468 RepID=A0A9X1WJN6_9VIBR|nr:LysR family transcriptional regulator [Vibrio gelatinilyticus]MCJ2377969.1 LysR family transcriptional regulator [Vibrio gelatinilyticus]
MNLTKLRVFALTADHGSLTKVAHLMGKTRTSLSMALSSLEDELGVELFERTRNRLVLNDAGEALLPDCRNILNMAESLYSKAEQFRQGDSDKIRIAYDDTLPSTFWRKQLVALSDAFPHVSLTAIKASSPDIPSLVKDNHVDLAYGLVFSSGDDPMVKVRALHRIRMMAVCSPKHPLAKLNNVTSTDISAHRQIIQSHLYEEIHEDFKPISSSTISFSNYQEMLEAVIDNLGWAIIPETLVKQELRQEHLVVVKHPNGMYYESFGEISRPNDQSMETRQSLIDGIEEGIYDLF